MINREYSGLAVVGGICEKDKATNRDNILAWEEKAKELPQIDIPVKHHIHGGMYGREITIPEGSIITGQIYKFDHFDIMISGDISVSTDCGEVKRLTGFNIFKGLSGKKRAGYAHEDTRWVTFHPFDGVDGDKIQDFITADNFDELDNFYLQLNRNDYASLVYSFGMNQEEIDKQVHNTDDLTAFPNDYDHLKVKASTINGLGFFTDHNHETGDIICPARIDGKRTPAGRYTNHAVNANAAILVNDDGNADLVAVRPISVGDELMINYRELLNHRFLTGDLCQE